MNPEILNAYKAANPIRRLYQKAINAAQNGKPDNDYKQYRYYVLHQLVQYAAKRFPMLDLVECGCWHGHSTMIIADLMQSEKSSGRLHVFDSFKGLSEFRDVDVSPFMDTAKKRASERVHYASDIHRLRRLVEPFGFVDLHKGWIPDVFIDVGEIAFASIDVNLYEPTHAAVEFAYTHLVPGGAIYFDDYGYATFPGAKTAIDDYLRTVSPTLFIENPMGSAYLVK
jgi:hypothetical protein